MRPKGGAKREAVTRDGEVAEMWATTAAPQIGGAFVAPNYYTSTAPTTSNTYSVASFTS